ncbi:efflux RND transporter periplasmic adaptor subunit [Methylobacillus gramineus]|uniref:efflux RND transporter periplasmic adaptor subunit n=1 Tax=Methylobacillus gramineus TaxID=755169 RepID=UPI001CFFD5E1|nr:efflux RND transporter periplasmic adaptor subunit [Methylobacillus gramineus]MCB5184174.1 efflux RND transporter periplasmic adaptor subunit [Methylobacillus gramineus]
MEVRVSNQGNINHRGLGSSKKIVVAMMAALTLISCSKSEQQAGPPGGGQALPVTVLSIEPTSVPVSAETVAQTEGAREVEIRPRVGGILLKRLYEEGSAVKEGQALFQIDPVPYQIALAQAKAQWAQQKAKIDQTQREADRLKGLLESQSISQREYDNAVSDNSVAQAALQQAEASIREAELNLSYTKVTAPVSGVSGRFQFSEGALVSANDSLLTTVVQLSPIWVRFSLSDNELEQLGGRLTEKNVQKISLTLPDGKEYSENGKLNFAASQIDPTLGTQQLRATFNNADKQLIPGQFVRAKVTVGQRDGVFLVPQASVMSSQQGKFVYVVNEKNEATVRPVVAGNWIGSNWVILKGLNAGEKVVIDNLIKIRPGAPVQPHPPAEAPAAEGGAPQKAAANPSGKHA